MNSKQRSFSDLRCNGAKLGYTQWLLVVVGYCLPLTFYLSCTLPETELSQQPIEILLSNRERKAPPILGYQVLGNPR